MSIATTLPEGIEARRRWHPYPTYRPAAVPWLGPVPDRWSIKRLKYVVRLVNNKTEDPAGLSYIGLEHIESWTGRHLEPDVPVQPEGMSNVFGPHDVLFGKLRPYLAKVLLARDAGVCTTEALVLRSRSLEPAFLFYWMLNRDLISVVDGSTYGSKMPRANWEFIGNLPTCVPSLEEQRAIATFLDRETARIDAMIAGIPSITANGNSAFGRMIRLLQEYRSALISAAVTGKIDVRGEIDPLGALNENGRKA